MANVTYEKRQIIPSSNSLVFYKRAGNSIISEDIKLTFKIIVDPAQTPIRKIELTVDMLYPNFYQFQGIGSTHKVIFNNIPADFISPEIVLNVEIVDPTVPLQKKVAFKVTVMDVDQGIPWPLTGNYGFYSWEPTPPPTQSLLNNIPNTLI